MKRIQLPLCESELKKQMYGSIARSRKQVNNALMLRAPKPYSGALPLL